MATPTTTGSELLNTLMNDVEEEGNDETAVEAVLSLDDVTVEIDQYTDSKQKEGGDDFEFISGSTPTLAQTVEYEVPQEVELEPSDAPASPVVFDLGDESPMTPVPEPVHTGLGNLYSPSVKTETDDDLTGSIGPVAGSAVDTPDLPDLSQLKLPLANGALTSAVQPTRATPDIPAIPVLPTVTAQPAPVANPTLPTPPPVPAEGLPQGWTMEQWQSYGEQYLASLAGQKAQPVSAPLPSSSQVISTPEIPVVVGTENPAAAQITTIGEAVATTEQTPAPVPQNDNRIWPWPAKKAWDSRQVYREVVTLLEQIKAGQMQKAAQTLDHLGPHLSENLDMLLHIGSVMRALNREEHLQWTLSMAKHVHPNNQHVEAAANQLSQG
jgi:hypothetical protein